MLQLNKPDESQCKVDHLVILGLLYVAVKWPITITVMQEKKAKEHLR